MCFDDVFIRRSVREEVANPTVKVRGKLKHIHTRTHTRTHAHIHTRTHAHTQMVMALLRLSGYDADLFYK